LVQNTHVWIVRLEPRQAEREIGRENSPLFFEEICLFPDTWPTSCNPKQKLGLL
jgi:hypothetical protein